MTYSAAWKLVDGVQVAVLRDHERDMAVEVAPALGNTCLALRVGDWQVLDEPPDAAALRDRWSSYGAPILFPFPNRVRDGRFRFGGREYHLPRQPGSPNAIHGLVRNRPWQPRLCRASAESAVIWSEIRGADFPELADVYPSSFSLLVAYWLRDGRLEIDAQVENVGQEGLPFGFGLHPYFRLPLGPSGSRAACELRVPAAQIWALRDRLPTGRRRPAIGRDNLRQLEPLGDRTFDDVLTGLAQPFQALLRDPRAGREIVVEAGPDFQNFVVFAPSERSVVALEPYTCATDALNLEPRGVEAGLLVLPPGERWSGRLAIIPRLL